MSVDPCARQKEPVYKDFEVVLYFKDACKTDSCPSKVNLNDPVITQEQASSLNIPNLCIDCTEILSKNLISEEIDSELTDWLKINAFQI